VFDDQGMDSKIQTFFDPMCVFELFSY